MTAFAFAESAAASARAGRPGPRLLRGERRDEQALTSEQIRKRQAGDAAAEAAEQLAARVEQLLDRAAAVVAVMVPAHWR